MDEKVTEDVAAGGIPDTELQQLDFQHVPLSAARSPLPAEVEKEIIDVSRRFSRMESRESSSDLSNDAVAMLTSRTVVLSHCNITVHAGREIHANTVVQRSGNVEVKAGRQETIFEGVSTSRSVARLQPLTQQQVIPTEDEPEVEEAPDVANSRTLFRQEQSLSLPQDEPDLEKRGPSAALSLFQEEEIRDIPHPFPQSRSRETSPDPISVRNDVATEQRPDEDEACSSSSISRSVSSQSQESFQSTASTSRSVARLQPPTQQQVIPTEDEPEVEEAPAALSLFQEEEIRDIPLPFPQMRSRETSPDPISVRNDVATEQRPDEDEACSLSSISRSVSSQSQESFQSTDGACEEVSLGNQVYHRHAGCITSLFFLQTAKSTCAEKFIEAGFHRTPYLCRKITAKENQNIRVKLTVDGGSEYKIEPEKEQVVSVAHVVKHEYYQVEYLLKPLPDFKTGFLDLKYFYRVGRRKATTLPIRLRPPTEEDRKSSGSSQGCGGCPPVMHFTQSQDNVTAEAHVAHHGQLKSSRHGTKTIIKRKRSSRPLSPIRSGGVEKRKKMQS